MANEDDIIARYFRPLAVESESAAPLDLRDDAAFLKEVLGKEHVVTTDMIIAGTHFLEDDAPRDIALKALGVNVSDLIAKGAVPEGYLLALAFPGTPDDAWLAGFAEGLREGLARWGGTLLGGDLSRTEGPLVIAVTAIGRVRTGGMVRRSGARAGDRLFVSGTIGDAALGLSLRLGGRAADEWDLSGEAAGQLIERDLQPAPPLGLVPLLGAFAHAAIDISDGLVLDCSRLCRASGCAAHILAELVPLSEPARGLLASGAVTLAALLTSGDDYQVLAAIPPARAEAFAKAAESAGVRVTDIGEVVAAEGEDAEGSSAEGAGEGKGVGEGAGQGAGEIFIAGPDGSPLRLERGGHDHFG